MLVKYLRRDIAELTKVCVVVPMFKNYRESIAKHTW